MIVIEGAIKGKARPRFKKNGKRPHNTIETIKYEAWVRKNYKEQCGKFFKGPIKVFIVAYFKIPKSYTKKQREAIKIGELYPTKKPDSDNIAKIILDALNSIAYKDDTQVVDLVIVKRYTELNERIELKIKHI